MMEIRSYIVLVSAGVLLGNTNYVRATGCFPSSLFELILNGILGYFIAALLIAIAFGLANYFSVKKQEFEDALVVASSTIVTMCLGFLFLKYSVY